MVGMDEQQSGKALSLAILEDLQGSAQTPEMESALATLRYVIVMKVIVEE
jgi:hypothetical protein